MLEKAILKNNKELYFALESQRTKETCLIFETRLKGTISTHKETFKAYTTFHESLHN